VIRAGAVGEVSPVERCSRCGTAFDRAAWRLLTIVQRMDPPEIQLALLNWPAGLSIEVRRCTKCGSHLARKAPRGLVTS
jgi:hypothetical protein